MEQTLLNNRYAFESELGRGGMGIVYRATDTLLQRPVAVKVLSSASLGSQGRARLLREAQAAARLNHPNIINVFDAGDAGERAYIVMELLDGDSLYERKGKMALDETLDVLRQICDALAHAHANGIIHRDLKPENVIVTSRGVAKLTDFGLSRSVTARVSQDGVIVGTVYYLAPEQALRQEIDHRADLYALGVMMYELITGRLPFTADDPLGVISQHLNAPAVPPSTYNPDTPPVLENLILQLMSKNPDERPASAAEVRYTLDHLFDADGLKAITMLSPLDRLVRGRLINRQSEFAQVKTTWHNVMVGAGLENVLALIGESGVGKTPFLREIRSLAQVSGAKVASAECYARGGTPLMPVTHLLHQLQPLPEGINDLVLADVATLAPELVAQPLPANPPLSPLSEQQRLFESLFTVFSTIAETQPLALIIDDAHWADTNTLLLIRHMARRARATHLRLMIVLSYREDDVVSNRAFNEVLLDLRQERLVETVTLLPFTREGTREILEAMFVQPISDPFLNAIYKVTSGNLYFIEEVCKALIEEGRLACNGGQWQLDGIDNLKLPESVRVTLEARLQRLPDAALDLLRMAAIIGREFDYRVLRTASENQDEDAMIDILESAQNAQLIQEVEHSGAGERFVFAHALIPALLRDQVSSLRRHRMHRQVAQAIERTTPDDMEMLSFHYSQAGDLEKARYYTIRAADRARKLYANEEALAFYNTALSWTPEKHEDRFHILQARAQIYNLTSQREAQRADIEALVDLAEELDRDDLRCDALIALTDMYRFTDTVRVHEPALRAVELARMLQDPVREARALQCLGWNAWTRSDFHESLTALEGAVQRFRQANLPAQAAESLHMLSLVTGMQGLGELEVSRQYAQDAIQLSRLASDPRQEAISLRRLAIVTMDQGEHLHALEIAQQALALHRELDDHYEESMALNSIGVMLSHLGRMEDAKQYFEQALKQVEKTGSITGFWMVYANIQWLIYHREGRYDESLAFADAQLAKPAFAENPYLETNILKNKADILYTVGHYEEALAILEQVKRVAAQFTGMLSQTDAYLGIALNYAALKNFPAARAALEQARDLSKQLERPNDVAYVSMIDAEISRREWETGHLSQIRHAQAQIDHAISLLRDTRWFSELAFCQQTAAWLALANNQPEKALEYARASLEYFERQPARPEGYEYVYVCALWANDQEEEAQRYLEQAYQRVISVSRTIEDETLRRSWLEAVQVNQQIIRDWALYHT